MGYIDIWSDDGISKIGPWWWGAFMPWPFGQRWRHGIKPVGSQRLQQLM